MARTLIPLAQGCEELEAVTIIDLLRRAGIEVITAGLEAGPVIASRGVVLHPDTTISEVMDQSFDMIVLPGGLPGADNLERDSRIRELLQRNYKEGKYTAAICAAPKVLASFGLLNGRKATSYPGALDGMDLPQVELSSMPVIRDENVITSRGPGTAMDFALELIEVLAGGAKRDEVELQLVRAS